MHVSANIIFIAEIMLFPSRMYPKLGFLTQFDMIRLLKSFTSETIESYNFYNENSAYNLSFKA